MSKAQVGAERVFNLGPYKSLRLNVTFELDDLENFTELEVDSLRYATLLNVYRTYAYHERLMEMFKREKADNSEAILAIVESELNNLDTPNLYKEYEEDE